MRIFFPLLFFFFTLPCFGQSKKELCRQVLASAKTFKDIAPVYNIIAREKDIFKYVPTAKPIKGKYRLSSNFGNRFHPIRRKNIFHSGLDMAAQYATTVHSTASGTVIFAGIIKGYGKKVVVAHQYGFVTCYAHLTYIYAKVGKRVKKGECIGFVGSTGMSTGNHLHYEIIKNKRFINPINFINHE